LMRRADAMFGQVITDPTTGHQDLGINVSQIEDKEPFAKLWLSQTNQCLSLFGVQLFLQKTILDADGALKIGIEDLPFKGFDAVLFKSHDAVSITTITATAFRFVGLDSFKEFKPFDVYSHQSMGNWMHLDSLKIEMDVRVIITPSNLADSILRNMNMNMKVIEDIRLSFGVDNLYLGVFAGLFIDENALFNLELGSLLRQQNIAACIASVLKGFRIAGLRVSVGNLHEPVLTGFDEGIEYIVTKGTLSR
jgi:hypothetical protein